MDAIGLLEARVTELEVLLLETRQQLIEVTEYLIATRDALIEAAKG